MEPWSFYFGILPSNSADRDGWHTLMKSDWLSPLKILDGGIVVWLLNFDPRGVYIYTCISA
jgi:hypothetical protein